MKIYPIREVDLERTEEVRNHLTDGFSVQWKRYYEIG